MFDILDIDSGGHVVCRSSKCLQHDILDVGSRQLCYTVVTIMSPTYSMSVHRCLRAGSAVTHEIKSAEMYLLCEQLKRCN